MSERVFDQGLQPERTLLAWRRTCLAFVVASVAAIRFTVDAFGPLAVMVGLVTAAVAGAAYFAMAHGYRRAHRALVADEAHSTPGVAVALACVATLLLGATCAGYVIAGLG